MTSDGADLTASTRGRCAGEHAAPSTEKGSGRTGAPRFEFRHFRTRRPAVSWAAPSPLPSSTSADPDARSWWPSPSRSPTATSPGLNHHRRPCTRAERIQLNRRGLPRRGRRPDAPCPVAVVVEGGELDAEGLRIFPVAMLEFSRSDVCSAPQHFVAGSAASVRMPLH